MNISHDILDRFAESYYLNPSIATIQLEELAQKLAMHNIIAGIGNSETVLSMGFGTGLVTSELLKAGIHHEVVEGSRLLCEAAKQRHRELVIHYELFESFIPETPYDCILALHVIEHVENPQKMLKRIRSWLVPNGRVIVVAPNCESLHRRIAVLMGLHTELDFLGPSDHLMGHQRVYSLTRLREEVAGVGFNINQEFGYLLKTVPNSIMSMYSPEMVRALNTISEEFPPNMLANIGLVASKTEERPDIV